MYHIRLSACIKQHQVGDHHGEIGAGVWKVELLKLTWKCSYHYCWDRLLDYVYFTREGQRFCCHADSSWWAMSNEQWCAIPFDQVLVDGQTLWIFRRREWPRFQIWWLKRRKRKKHACSLQNSGLVLQLCVPANISIFIKANAINLPVVLLSCWRVLLAALRWTPQY